jgi:anti-sigma factor ChrR (cupin superfamily)
LGEEIFVLEGIFSDEYGDYPAGTYIRNPPNSCHSPFSREGCVIFVKLNQFHPNDQERVVIETPSQPWLPGQGGLTVMPLHEFETQHTALVRWPAGERFVPHRHWGGEEILVLQGEFCDEHGRYPSGTWIRSPHMSEHFPYVEEETIIFVKVGHLPQ